MSMNIGAVIKKLRQERGMVQEQVAEYLNVSTQAISRWETGSALPDITQVPALANLFGCSSDTLLGVDIAAARERIDAICKDSVSCILEKRHDEAEEMLRAGLREYPNNHHIMVSLALVLFNSGRNWGDKAEKRVIQEEIVVLCEKVLAECTDDKIRHRAIQHLYPTYITMGETDKAVSLANRMPYKHLSRESLIADTLKGTEKYRYKQKEIATEMMWALQNIVLLRFNRLDDGTDPYSLDECIVLHNKVIDIINILVEEGNYGDYNWLLADTHLYLAFLNSEGDDAVTALNHFRLAAKHAVLHDAILQNNDDLLEEYTNLLFRGIKCRITKSAAPFSKSKFLLDRSHEFDSVLPASELEEIKKELCKYAI